MNGSLQLFSGPTVAAFGAVDAAARLWMDARLWIKLKGPFIRWERMNGPFS